MERLVRAAQEVSDQAAREGAREERKGSLGGGRTGERGVASRPAPRTASIADLERAEDEGMSLPLEER